MRIHSLRMAVSVRPLFFHLFIFFSFFTFLSPEHSHIVYARVLYLCDTLIRLPDHMCECSIRVHVSLAISPLLYIYCHSPFASEITAHNNLIYGIFTVRLFYCQFNSDRSTTSMPNIKCWTPNQIETQIERNLSMYRVQSATSATMGFFRSFIICLNFSRQSFSSQTFTFAETQINHEIHVPRTYQPFACICYKH